MASTVKIPGIGDVDKKWLYVGGALVAGIVGYAYWSRSSAEESEIADYTTPDYAMDSSVDEYVNPGGSQAPVDEDYLATPSNNAEWGQMASQLLSDLGYDTVAAAVAVGKYLGRLTLSRDQADMIRAARAQLGPPPTGEFPIKESPTPDPDPEPELKPPTNIRVTNIYHNKARLEWNAVPGAYGYVIYKEGQVPATEHAIDTDAFVSSLKPNTTYRFYIKTFGPNNTFSKPSAKVTVKTKKK